MRSISADSAILLVPDAHLSSSSATFRPIRMTFGARTVLLVGLVAAISLALWHLDLAAVGRAFTGMSWGWGLTAAAVNLTGLVVDAWRWRFVITAERPVPLRHTFRALVAGVIGNVVMPLKLGDGARTLLISRSDGLSAATALTTVLLDRLIDSATLPLFVGLASLVLPLPASITKYRPLMWLIVIVTTLLITLAGYLIRRQPVREASLETGRTLERVLAGLAALGHASRLVKLVGTGLLSWSVRALVIWCMIQAFHLPLSPAAAVSTLAAIYLSGAISPTPGNLASFELAAAGALGLWGVSGDTGLSLGIATHALEILPTLALGLAMGVRPGRAAASRPTPAQESAR